MYTAYLQEICCSESYVWAENKRSREDGLPVPQASHITDKVYRIRLPIVSKTVVFGTLSPPF